MRIAEPGREELIGGEQRVFARPLQEGREGIGQGGGGGVLKRAIHGQKFIQHMER